MQPSVAVRMSFSSFPHLVLVSLFRFFSSFASASTLPFFVLVFHWSLYLLPFDRWSYSYRPFDVSSPVWSLLLFAAIPIPVLNYRLIRLTLLLSIPRWMLGIVDPGVWLATLKTEAMKLTVGETIGWLPGTHVADTDIDVAKLLHSAVAAASVSIERHASVSHGAHVVDTQTNSDTALQLPVTAFTSRLAATSVSLEQPGMGEHEASDGKTSVPSKAAPNPPTMADFVAAWIASSVAAIARGDEIPEAGDTQTDSHRDLIYDNTDGRAPSSRSCHSPPVMFAEVSARWNKPC